MTTAQHLAARWRGVVLLLAALGVLAAAALTSAPRAEAGERLVVRNGSFETWGTAATPRCWQVQGRGSSRARLGASTTAHTGQRAVRLTVPEGGSVAASAVVTPSGTCAQPARPGSRFVVAAWYRGSDRPRMTVRVKGSSGWRLLGHSARFPARGIWTRMSWTTPRMPADAVAITVGAELSSPGSVLLDDVSVRVPTLATSPTVTAGSAAATSTLTPTVTVTSSAATPGSTRLPRRVAGIYWTNWGKNTRLDRLPAGYNVIYAAFAYGDGSGTGRAVFKPDDGSGVSRDAFLTQVHAAQGAGKRVLLSVGGANPVGLELLSAADVEQFTLSIQSIVDTYGFDGIDWDLEQQNIFTADNLLAATQRLKTRYGSDFIVTAAPAPSSIAYKVFAQKAGGLLDYIAPQYYGYADTNRVAGIQSRTAELVTTYGVPARKIGIGCKVGSDAYSAPAAFWRDAIKSLRRSYPDVAGGMVWDATAERLAGDTFAAVTVPALLKDATP